MSGDRSQIGAVKCSDFVKISRRLCSRFESISRSLAFAFAFAIAFTKERVSKHLYFSVDRQFKITFNQSQDEDANMTSTSDKISIQHKARTRKINQVVEIVTKSIVESTLKDALQDDIRCTIRSCELSSVTMVNVRTVACYRVRQMLITKFERTLKEHKCQFDVQTIHSSMLVVARRLLKELNL